MNDNLDYNEICHNCGSVSVIATKHYLAPDELRLHEGQDIDKHKPFESNHYTYCSNCGFPGWMRKRDIKGDYYDIRTKY